MVQFNNAKAIPTTVLLMYRLIDWCLTPSLAIGNIQKLVSNP